MKSGAAVATALTHSTRVVEYFPVGRGRAGGRSPRRSGSVNHVNGRTALPTAASPPPAQSQAAAVLDQGARIGARPMFRRQRHRWKSRAGEASSKRSKPSYRPCRTRRWEQWLAIAGHRARSLAAQPIPESDPYPQAGLRPSVRRRKLCLPRPSKRANQARAKGQAVRTRTRCLAG